MSPTAGMIPPPLAAHVGISRPGSSSTQPRGMMARGTMARDYGELNIAYRLRHMYPYISNNLTGLI